MSASPKMSKHQNKMICSIHILRVRICISNLLLPLPATAGVPASTKPFPLFLARPVRIILCLARSLGIHYIAIISFFSYSETIKVCKAIGKQGHHTWPLLLASVIKLPLTRHGGWSCWESVLLSSVAISRMPARYHSFYQKLLLPPPWVVTQPLGTPGTPLIETSPYNTALLPFPRPLWWVVILKAPEPSGVQIKGESTPTSIYYFYIQLRYKKNRSGQYI